MGNLCQRNANTEESFREMTRTNVSTATQDVRRKTVTKYKVEF